MTSEIRIRFEAPQAGWLPLRVSCGDQEIEADVSHVYAESLEQLVAAVVHSLDETATFWAVFLLEPTELVFEFKAEQGQVGLRIYERAANAAVEERLNAEGLSSLDVARTLWSALRDVWSRSGGEAWEKHWSSGFPESSVTNLGRRVAGG